MLLGGELASWLYVFGGFGGMLGEDLRPTMRKVAKGATPRRAMVGDDTLGCICRVEWEVAV